MTHWIIKKSQGFTNLGLLRVSESARAYVYLILSLQASARSKIIGNPASALSAQKAFLNNFENAVNWRVDIREPYQNTLSYALSKVDYRMGESIYMLPTDINLNIKLGTVGYNNRILISDGKFSLGKNDKVNTLELAKERDKTKISHKVVITHKEEKVALVLSLAGGLAICYAFR